MAWTKLKKYNGETHSEIENHASKVAGEACGCLRAL